MSKILTVPYLFSEALHTQKTPAELMELLHHLKCQTKHKKLQSARMGWVLERLGWREEALKELRRHPKFPLSRSFEARILASQHFGDTSFEEETLHRLEQDVLGPPGDLSIIEARMNFTFARAVFLNSLGRYDQVPSLLQQTLTLADHLHFNVLVPAIYFQWARMEIAQGLWTSAIDHLVDVILSPFSTLEMAQCACDMLLVSCLMTGKALPVALPAWLYSTHQLMLGNPPGTSTEEGLPISEDGKVLQHTFQTLNDLLEFTFEFFPLEKAQEQLQKKQEWLDTLDALPLNGDYYRDVFVLFAQVVGFGVSFDSRCEVALEKMSAMQFGNPLIRCLQTFARLHCKVYLGDHSPLPIQFVQHLREAWDQTSNEQKVQLTHWLWKYMPSVPFVMEDLIKIPFTDVQVARVFSNAIVVNGVRVDIPPKSYRYLAIHRHLSRLQQPKHPENTKQDDPLTVVLPEDSRQLRSHAMVMRIIKAQRWDFDQLSSNIKRLFIEAGIKRYEPKSNLDNLGL